MAELTNESYGKFVIGVRDALIISGSDYANLEGIQSATFDVTFGGVEITGDDVILSRQSYAKTGTVSFQLATWSSAAMGLLVGNSLTVSGTGSTEATLLQISAGDTAPYVKLYFRALDDDDGCMHVYCKKAKILDRFGLALAYEQGSAPTITAQLFDDATNGYIQVKTYETDTALPTS